MNAPATRSIRRPWLSAAVVALVLLIGLGLFRATRGGPPAPLTPPATAPPPLVPPVLAETTGDPEIEAIYREVQAQGATTLGAILGGQSGAAHLGDPRAHEMAAQVMRGGLAGLAIWWSDHPEVPREEIVAAALNVVWIGLDRVRRGETFKGSDP